MADRILVMDDGRIVQAGTPEETYFHPANAFVATLFGPVNRLHGRVSNGGVETPLGTFDAAGLADGSNAQVMVRPEGLAVQHAVNGHGLAARVVNARLLGNAMHLRLVTDGGARDPLELQARIYGDRLPERGSSVRVNLVKINRAFVFPI